MSFISSSPFGRALSRPGAGRIPVTILTGFLGAGKSTALKRYLESAEGSDTAVIVNEFGEIGIDNDLLVNSSETIRLIGNGCLCCAARSDLAGSLYDLYAERSRGCVPQFRQVVVETSGLVDPSPLIMTLANDRTLSEHYAPGNVVAVVDAKLGVRSAAEFPEWRKQVALADRILLTKTELVDQRGEKEVVSLIKDLNPAATIHRPEQDAPSVLNEGEAGGAGAIRAPDKLADQALETSAHEFQSFLVKHDRPVPWQRFSAVLNLIALTRGEGLLRVKGFVNVEGRPGPVVVHQVQHLSHAPEELRSWPTEDRSTRLVFITRGISSRKVRDLFDAALGL